MRQRKSTNYVLQFKTSIPEASFMYDVCRENGVTMQGVFEAFVRHYVARDIKIHGNELRTSTEVTAQNMAIMPLEDLKRIYKLRVETAPSSIKAVAKPAEPKSPGRPHKPPERIILNKLGEPLSKALLENRNLQLAVAKQEMEGMPRFPELANTWYVARVKGNQGIIAPGSQCPTIYDAYENILLHITDIENNPKMKHHFIDPTFRDCCIDVESATEKELVKWMQMCHEGRMSGFPVVSDIEEGFAFMRDLDGDRLLAKQAAEELAKEKPPVEDAEMTEEESPTEDDDATV